MGYDDPSLIEALAPVIGAIQDELRGRSVLEVACGPGFWTRSLVQAGCMVFASDYNASMLGEALKAQIEPHSRYLVAADAYSMPFRENAFEGAFACDWLAHVPRDRIQAFLKGLGSTVKPGSPVVFCDQLPSSGSIETFDSEGNHVQERKLPDGSTYQVIKHFFSDSELVSLLSEHSRGEIEIVRFPEVRRIVVGYFSN
jgi:ubiquinone/menaquinone biosynthesis C-methylase UbiE